MQIYSGGQGVVGPSDQTTARTLHTSPLLSNEQFKTCSSTPPNPVEGAIDVDRPKTDRAEEWVEAGFDNNVDVEATFPGYSHVTSMGSIVTTFLVSEEIIPINIENIPGNYRLFNLFFIICF